MGSLLSKRVTLGKPVFVVSVDTELAWGSFDKGGVKKYEAYYKEVRNVVDKLLALFDIYGIKATWALVGHLFLRSCSANGPDNHNHVLQPKYTWYPPGWLSHDPHSDMNEAPFFYAPDIVDKILASAVVHEIATHTFTHAILGDPECSREVAYSQLDECKRLALNKGINQVSVVFPRNSIGHLDVLCEHGFSSFRGPEKNWYQACAPIPTIRGVCHFADRLLTRTPPCYDELVYYQSDNADGCLFDLPASMFLVPYVGLWRLVALSRRVVQAKRGIKEATRKKGLFHLWFHPFNLAASPEMFDVLEEILSFVSSEIRSGNILSLTMEQTAQYAQNLMNQGR